MGWETMTSRSCDPQLEAESGTEVGRAWQTRGTERRPMVGSTFLPHICLGTSVCQARGENGVHAQSLAACNADANEVSVVVSNIASSSFPAGSTPWAAGPRRSSIPPLLQSRWPVTHFWPVAAFPFCGFAPVSFISQETALAWSLAKRERAMAKPQLTPRLRSA